MAPHRRYELLNLGAIALFALSVVNLLDQVADAQLGERIRVYRSTVFMSPFMLCALAGSWIGIRLTSPADRADISFDTNWREKPDRYRVIVIASICIGIVVGGLFRGWFWSQVQLVAR